MGCNCGRHGKPKGNTKLPPETQERVGRSTASTKSTNNKISKLEMLKKIWRESKNA